ncbi:hypothetical protein [Acidaminobacterium chupaoyuni]
MMSAEERTALISRRTQALRQKREQRRDAKLATVCCALSICLVGLFHVLTDGGGASHMPGLYGSALLYGGAGGYVLAGVLAFAAGVIVTVLCMRSQKGKRKHEINEETPHNKA